MTRRRWTIGASPPGRAIPVGGTTDRGAGLIGAISGLLVFLALLLFAVQTLVGLYTRSVVTEAAHEGARMVAGARVDHSSPGAVADARVRAEAEVRRLLGRFGDTVELDWSGSTAETVALRVRAHPPGFLWAALRGPGSALVERTVHVRVEALR
ncbi:TadE/TadG family type IV pilus assembly protein [Rhabdothermincola salaria]|uniref:TadE/TadG family type IV pilus assembly protein n=1 Tax=Rhabdothermincola salaria TaxID=2903142 RepID=UPI001E56A231|nr:TadE/TadG family type IV pilus assembly protein [Rhabdothermincola salaria]MCD9622364.1 hypothetical protein [Rhabdothermincola salaria]